MSGVVPALPSLSPDLVNIILAGPAQAAPTGEVNDFNTTNTLHPATIATIVLTLILSTLVVLARLYTKVAVLRTPGWDDSSVWERPLTSQMVFVTYSGLCIKVNPRAGIHIWDRTVADVIFVLRVCFFYCLTLLTEKYANYIEILYSPMILFVKISILLQYNRIFVPTFRSTPWTWLAIWLTIGCNVIFYLTIFFICIFQCSPREAIWDVFVEGQCYNITKLLITVAAFNLASDIIILVIPQYSIWKLQMTRRRKVGLSAVFGIGALACIVTALRVQSTVRLIDTLDVTWYLVPSALWTLAEVCLAYLASCLPTMPKFFQTVSGTLSRFTSNYGSRSNAYASNTTSEYKEKPVYAEPNRFERNYRREDRIEPAPHSREGQTWYRDDDADTMDSTNASTQNDWILPPTPPEEEPHRMSMPLRSPTIPPRAAPSRSLDVTRPAHPILGRIPTRSMDLPRPALQPQEAQARAAGLAPPIWRQKSRPLAVEVPQDGDVSDRSTAPSNSLPPSRPGEHETRARSQPGSRPSEPPSPIETRPRERQPPQPPPKDPPKETVPSPTIRRSVDVDDSQRMPRSRRGSAPRHIAQLYRPDEKD